MLNYSINLQGENLSVTFFFSQFSVNRALRSILCNLRDLKESWRPLPLVRFRRLWLYMVSNINRCGWVCCLYCPFLLSYSKTLSPSSKLAVFALLTPLWSGIMNPPCLISLLEITSLSIRVSCATLSIFSWDIYSPKHGIFKITETATVKTYPDSTVLSINDFGHLRPLLPAISLQFTEVAVFALHPRQIRIHLPPPSMHIHHYTVPPANRKQHICCILDPENSNRNSLSPTH